jgi:hypothetical protein
MPNDDVNQPPLVEPAKLRALSLRQPWAEQVMRGEKVVEYRTRATQIRGTIYIYASLGRYSAQEEAEFADEAGFSLDDLPRGVLVGTVELYDCHHDRRYDEYQWHLRNPRRLAAPPAPRMKPQPVWFYPFGR